MTDLSTILPVVAVTSAVSGFLGWSMRAPAKTTAPAKTGKPAPAADKGQQERVKNLEAAVEKSKTAQKALKGELENLQTTSVTKAAHDATVAELEAARKESGAEAKRISALETDLRKSQETIKQLNARTNEADKAQKDRRFALENELSKAREELAILRNRPDDSVGLQTEIERLRESVAVSTRYAGEMRKRESAAVEALEKAEARIAELGEGVKPVVSKKIGPVGDSGRIAAAKAEVIRLIEQNKQKEVAAPAVADVVQAVAEEAPADVAEVPVVAEEVPVVVAEVPVVAEEVPAIVAEVPAVADEVSVAADEVPAAVEAVREVGSAAKQAELPLAQTLS